VLPIVTERNCLKLTVKYVPQTRPADLGTEAERGTWIGSCNAGSEKRRLEGYGSGRIVDCMHALGKRESIKCLSVVGIRLRGGIPGIAYGSSVRARVRMKREKIRFIAYHIKVWHSVAHCRSQNEWRVD
jgi:hypothetical protein